MTAPTVTLSPDGTTATLHGDRWSQVVPVDQLPKQRAFYARMAKDFPARAEWYLPWVAAIDGVGKP